MKILLATSKFPPEHSGVGIRLLGMYRRLLKKIPGFSFFVVSRRGGTDPELVPNILRINLAKPLRSRFRVLQLCFHFINLFRDVLFTFYKMMTLPIRSVDIVHTGGWSWMIYGICLFAKYKKIPLIYEVTSQGEVVPKNFGIYFVKSSLWMSDLVICISPALARMCMEIGIDKNKIWCRPNPVDTSRFDILPMTERLKLRKQLLPLHFTEGDKIILALGHIARWKNPGFLVRVLKYLPSCWKLCIVGVCYASDQEYFQEIQNLILEIGMEGRVFLHPESVKNPEDYIRACDVLGMPSLAEGLGNVILEALCCGVPVVANRIQDVTDWTVQDGENGFVCDLDEALFAKSIENTECLFDQAKRVAQQAHARFSSTVIDSEYEKHFFNLIKGSKLSSQKLV